jgi:hypothetical protein
LRHPLRRHHARTGRLEDRVRRAFARSGLNHGERDLPKFVRRLAR